MTEFKALDVKKVSGQNGEPFPCERFVKKYVQFGGTFSGEIEIQITLNGTDYQPVARCGGPGPIIAIPETCKYVRIHTITYTSGNPTAMFAGIDVRSAFLDR